jgi:hypothetical protein
MSVFPRWLRIAVLTVVALSVVTITAVVAHGIWAYVLAGIGLFLVIALGTPLALRSPSSAQPDARRAAVAP